MIKLPKKLAILAAAIIGAILLIPAHKAVNPRDRIVKLTGKAGQCSGEQIKAPSGESYILTAGHCSVLVDDGRINVETEDHKHLSRKFIAEDPSSDLMLIEGVPHMEGIPIALTSFPGQHVRTLTHGNGFATYQTEGVLIQLDKVEAELFAITNDAEAAKCASMPKQHPEGSLFGSICALDVIEIISTAMVVPGSSGGAVLNRHNELVAVVSAGGGPFSAFVKLADIRNFLNSY